MLVEIVMPQMGISVVEATVIAWRRDVGEEIAADEPICDISSDKVDSEVPAPAAGRVAELLVAVGETVDVGTVIATIDVGGDDSPPAGDGSAPAAATPEQAATAGPPAAQAPPAPQEPDPRRPPATPQPPDTQPATDRPRHSPLVQRLAAELGVDLDTLSGSGEGGRIRREDVVAAAAGSDLYRPPPPSELSRMRRTIGEHMHRSLHTAATVTSWIEVDFSAIEARRREIGTTALPIVAAATVATLAQFRELNAWLEGERHTLHEDVNLGIAVSLGDDGLIVPVIRAAQRLTEAELAARIADLAARARDRTLGADEVKHATFTITNPGQFGTLMATPVISQPQAAILDVEAIVRRAVVVEDRIEIRPIAILGLSWDHRALDGVYAARFLAALRERLQALG
ncbi:MAG TPA: dihydrolipoamide acetyltransferase family protein [Solirubrobacteraceae bacterium]|nr:dihydrolipoamide acetyltransferase family protein [Solirubrobacteraceae bacterium]